MIKYLLFITLFLPQFVYSQSDEMIFSAPPPRALEVQTEEVDQKPIHIGCENLSTENLTLECTGNKLYGFINQHLRYPVAAIENAIEGTVVAKFTIEKDGSMKDIHIVKDIGVGCGNEVKRVLTLLAAQPPVWKPAINNGENVSYLYTFPFRFKLN
jgi:protein TonB